MLNVYGIFKDALSFLSKKFREEASTALLTVKKINQ